MEHYLNTDQPICVRVKEGEYLKIDNYLSELSENKELALINLGIDKILKQRVTEEITRENLITKINEGKLYLNVDYIITDYVCNDPGFSSFDNSNVSINLVLTAKNNNTLNTKGYIIPRVFGENELSTYLFGTSEDNLKKFEIEYDISSNVITKMICKENNVEAPFDFLHCLLTIEEATGDDEEHGAETLFSEPFPLVDEKAYSERIITSFTEGNFLQEALSFKLPTNILDTFRIHLIRTENSIDDNHLDGVFYTVKKYIKRGISHPTFKLDAFYNYGNIYSDSKYFVIIFPSNNINITNSKGILINEGHDVNITNSQDITISIYSESLSFTNCSETTIAIGRKTNLNNCVACCVKYCGTDKGYSYLTNAITTAIIEIDRSNISNVDNCLFQGLISESLINTVFDSQFLGLISNSLIFSVYDSLFTKAISHCVLNSLNDFYILCNKSGYFSYPITYSTFENTQKFILKDNDSFNKYVDSIENLLIKDGLSRRDLDFIIIIPSVDGQFITNCLLNMYSFPRGQFYLIINLSRLKMYYNTEYNRVDTTINY